MKFYGKTDDFDKVKGKMVVSKTSTSKYSNKDKEYKNGMVNVVLF